MISSNKDDTLSVVNFYAGKSIFVTGGTGFLGKILIEKILWSCPEIQNIYLLIRAKKNKNEISRLTTILSSPVFERLRKTRPHDLKKIIPIAGDLTKAHMNISPTDKETLINKVSVVFHVAATVRFNEPIKQALIVNTVGTKHLFNFCQLMQNLKAFVYVSTAFSNCNRKELKEEIYHSHDPDEIVSMMEILSDETAEAIATELMDKRPNTYTYTKALAENVLLKYHTKIPIVIIRPSIVLSSIQEPVPGWIDSWNGPTIFIAGILKGIYHVSVGHKQMVAHIVPADIVVNLIICAAWRAANIPGTPNIEVYHCCTSQQNPITWKEFTDYCTLSAIQNPAEQLLSYPHFSWQSNRIFLFVQTFFLEKVPIYIIGSINYIIGKSTIMVQFHRKLMIAQDLTRYFSTRQWKFLSNNTQLLSNLLNENDRKIFPFDVRSLHWPAYLQSYCLGIRHYLLKNSPDSLSLCRKRLEILKWVNILIPSLLFLCIIYFIFVFLKNTEDNKGQDVNI